MAIGVIAGGSLTLIRVFSSFSFGITIRGHIEIYTQHVLILFLYTGNRPVNLMKVGVVTILVLLRERFGLQIYALILIQMHSEKKNNIPLKRYYSGTSYEL